MYFRTCWYPLILFTGPYVELSVWLLRRTSMQADAFLFSTRREYINTHIIVKELLKILKRIGIKTKKK